MKQKTNNINYKHGLPFDKDLSSSIDNIKKRISQGFPSVVIIDGGSGQGKTTLAIHLTEYYQKKKINYTSQYAMGGDDFREKLIICYEQNQIVIIYDEAGDFDRANFMSQLNKRLNEIFDKFRTFKILVIIILPTFIRLPDSIFDKKIPRLLIYCHGREKTINYGNYSVYGLWRMKYLRKYSQDRRLISKSEIYKKVKPNKHGNFLNLPPERCAELDEISTKGKTTSLKSRIAEDKGLLNYKELSKKLNRSVGWVKHKVSDLDIDHDSEVGRKKYYSPEVFDQLKKQVKK